MSRQHCQVGDTAYAVDWDVLKAAVDDSFDRGFSIYDAYLVALAKTHGLTLVTADAKLFAKVKG
ncbi:MAG: type II toxin-antitoxin system VapC family toxin, partial [Dehalococcoidia bacterium]|nr:type II toxin-antitoxin system VapC family toxin [Dehalococcoidia bacterium]